VSVAKCQVIGKREQEDTSRGENRKLPSVAAPTEGVALRAFSPAGAPHRPVQGGAGRAFARRRVMDAQGAQAARARRRVRGGFESAASVLAES
jgi:hypothetical protein